MSAGVFQTEALATGRRRSADLDKNLLELHVYLVPVEKWQESRRLASSTVMNESISVGFVRVIPELNVYNLRREIMLQIGPEFANNEFVILKGVGRNFTQIKLHQEQQLKAKHFAPPFANEPEIFLLNIKREERVESSTSTTTTSFVNVGAESPKNIQGGGGGRETPAMMMMMESEREQQISELSTLIFPNLSLSPQGLQTVVADNGEQAALVHTEDSGVMSEDEHMMDNSGRSHGSPNMQLVRAVNDSFDSSKADDENDKQQMRFFGETAPAIVEAIPNLGSHQLFRRDEQDESQESMREEAMREEAILQDAGVSHRSPPRERPPLVSSNASASEFDSQINGGGGGDDGDFSVTFVILEDNDVPAEAAPPPPSAPEERPRREEDEEEEDEEAEEPQQFKLFENQQGKKLRRTKSDKEAEAETLKSEMREMSKMNRDEEARRHVLVGRASDLQNRLRIRKEKKQTALRAQLAQTKRAQVPLEHACSQLRLELDAAHRHLLSSLDNRDVPLRVKDGPSRKANLKMTACKMQNEINDLNRSIGSVKLRLESEIKLRTHVEMEIRQYRTDLSEKKSAVATLRSSRYAPPIHSRFTGISKV